MNSALCLLYQKYDFANQPVASFTNKREMSGSNACTRTCVWCNTRSSSRFLNGFFQSHTLAEL